MICTGCRGYDTKVHRVSFSKSLLKHIVRTKPPGGNTHETGAYVASAKIVLGNKLAPGEKSASGLYAVVKAASRWPLRATFFQEAAETWRLPGNRDVYECFVDRESVQPVQW